MIRKARGAPRRGAVTSGKTVHAHHVELVLLHFSDMTSIKPVHLTTKRVRIYANGGG